MIPRLKRRPAPGATLLVAERFTAHLPGLAGLTLPAGDAVGGRAGGLDIVLQRVADGSTRRIEAASPAASAPLAIAFAAFANCAGEAFAILVAEAASGTATEALLAQAEIGDRPPIELSQSSGTGFEEDDPDAALRAGIDHMWCDNSGIFLDGWIAHAHGTIRTMRLRSSVAAIEIAAFTPHARGDCGFRVYLPWRASDRLACELVLAEGIALDFPFVVPRGIHQAPPWSHAQPPPDQFGVPGAQQLHDAYHGMIDEVNDRGLEVAEVGSRNVSPAAFSKRTLFPRAARFIGIDVHAAPNVDVVGDAHYLDTLIGRASVDAVFSIAVLEHLATPWLFAAAVARTLRLGGLTFHATHQAWPIHEEPNDFWRFSDEALRVLFGPALGFEVIIAAMHNPVAMTAAVRSPDYASIPLVPGYAGSFILARKVREVDADAVRWPTTSEASDALARLYPRRDG